MRKLFKTLVLTVFLVNIASGGLVSLSAQDTTEDNVEKETIISDVEGLRIDLKKYTQDPNNHQVKFEMLLYPTVSSDRVFITWELSGNGLFPENFAANIKTTTKDGKISNKKITYTREYDSYGKTYLTYGANSEFKIISGNTYTIDVYVTTGTAQGILQLNGKAEAFQVAGNLVSSVSKILVTNSKGEVLPISEDFKKAKTSAMIRKILYISGGVIVALIFGFFALKWFLKWLDKDEVEEFDKLQKGNS